MKTKRMVTALAVVLLSAASVMAKDFRTVIFKVEQLHCESCEKKVKDNIKFEKGVKTFSTQLNERTVTVTYDAEKTNVEKLKAGFKKFKYEAVVLKEMKAEEKK